MVDLYCMCKNSRKSVNHQFLSIVRLIVPYGILSSIFLNIFCTTGWLPIITFRFQAFSIFLLFCLFMNRCFFCIHHVYLGCALMLINKFSITYQLKVLPKHRTVNILCILSFPHSVATTEKQCFHKLVLTASLVRILRARLICSIGIVIHLFGKSLFLRIVIPMRIINSLKKKKN